MASHETLRRAARAVQRTPMHPQWIAFEFKSRLDDWIAANATGTVIDVGVGNADRRSNLPHCLEYLSVDHLDARATGYHSTPDVWATASHLPFPARSADTLMLLDVMEHLSDPTSALSEAFRVLRPGGTLLISVPFAYPLHDVPNDFQRWTAYGLRRQLSSSGFSRPRVQPVGSPPETAALLGSIALASCTLEWIQRRSLLALLIPAIAAMVLLKNLAGRALGMVCSTRELMPYGYWVSARKAESP